MRFYLFFFLVFSSFVTFSQIDNKTFWESQRETLYLQGKDYISIDKDYSLEYGENLPALVKKEINGNTVILTYKTHRAFNDANRDRILGRYKVLVPSILEIKNVGNEIKVSFLLPVPNEDLMDLFGLSGYKGYKIMNE